MGEGDWVLWWWCLKFERERRRINEEGVMEISESKVVVAADGLETKD